MTRNFYGPSERRAASVSPARCLGQHGSAPRLCVNSSARAPVRGAGIFRGPELCRGLTRLVVSPAALYSTCSFDVTNEKESTLPHLAALVMSSSIGVTDSLFSRFRAKHPRLAVGTGLASSKRAQQQAGVTRACSIRKSPAAATIVGRTGRCVYPLPERRDVKAERTRGREEQLGGDDTCAEVRPSPRVPPGASDKNGFDLAAVSAIEASAVKDSVWSDAGSLSP